MRIILSAVYLYIIVISIIPECLIAKPITIPEIKQWTSKTGQYTFNSSTDIVINPAYYELLKKPVEIFKEDLAEVFKMDIQILKSSSPQKDDIYFTISDEDASIGNSGYLFDIGNYIEIKAISDTGAFYATRSLIQMLRQSKSIERGSAKDVPDYPERGLMLDNGRKYYSMKNMRDYIRELSYFKMNLFHLHISDFEGFRMQSAKYPFISSSEHYTKNELKELVSLAGKYYINIVPEIDVPNHFASVIKHFPQYQIHNSQGNSIGNCCIDFTNPDALSFLKDLFSEYLEIFTGNYWHLGCDEFTINSAELPQFEIFAKEKYGENAVSSDAFIWFINEMNSYFKANGKNLRIWNDVLENKLKENCAANLDKDIIIEYWDGKYEPNLIAQSGNKLVNCNSTYLYYVVGHGWRPNQEAIYKGWSITEFFGNKLLTENNSLLGSKMQIWADQAGEETEQQVFRNMQSPIRIFAHRNWNDELFKDDLNTFKKSFKAIGNAPFVYPDSILLPNDLCLFKKVISSSNENDELLPENAVDGDYTTRWSSAYLDTAWLQIDFEKVQPFTRVKLFWEWSYAKDYKIQVSDDAQVWNTVVTMLDSDGFIDDYVNLSASGRFLRVFCTRRNGFNGNSLWEIEAYDSTALGNIENFNQAQSRIWSVYPNPNNGEVKICYQVEYPSQVKIELYDLLGNKVCKLLDEYRSEGTVYEAIALSNVAEGEYFIRLLINNNAYFHKIIYKKK